jgi:hypothetical protein
MCLCTIDHINRLKTSSQERLPQCLSFNEVVSRRQKKLRTISFDCRSTEWRVRRAFIWSSRLWRNVEASRRPPSHYRPNEEKSNSIRPSSVHFFTRKSVYGYWLLYNDKSNGKELTENDDYQLIVLMCYENMIPSLEWLLQLGLLSKPY